MAKKKSSCGCLAAVGLGILVLVIFGDMMRTTVDTGSTPSQSSTTPREPEWYAGGTLHEATMADWQASSRRNRIATAADFLANVAKIKEETIDSFAEGSAFHQAAIGLVACIDEGGADQPQMKASEIAVACILLLEEM